MKRRPAKTQLKQQILQKGCFLQWIVMFLYKNASHSHTDWPGCSFASPMSYYLQHFSAHVLKNYNFYGHLPEAINEDL